MTTVPANARFTPEDALRLEDEGLFELVDGKLTEKTMSLLANLTAGKVLVALTNFASRSSIGFAVTEQSFQCFPNDRNLIRRPDVSFILADRMPADLTQGHVSVAPDIAVEVVSPTDLIYGLDEKLADYRTAGVKLVWVINPNSRTVRIHRLDHTVTELDESGILGGESVLPEFAVSIADLLPPVPQPARRYSRDVSRLRRIYPLLIVLGAGMFFTLLGTREFAASHEARVAQVAREMAAGGWPWNSTQMEVPAVHLVNKQGVVRLAADNEAPPVRVNPWIVPVLNGQIRLQKPPLPYWGAAIAFRIAGVSEATSRFIPALLGMLATLLMLDVGRLLYGQRIAIATALIWLTTFLVAEQFRLAMADPYLAFFTLAALWAWIKASDRSAPSSGRFIVLFYVCMALGALSKGPLIFIHVLVPLVLLHVCFKRRVPRGALAHALGVALFIVVALPWPLAVMQQVRNARELWYYESVGEVSGQNQENVREWWYYFVNLPLMSAPWVPLWVFSIIFILVRNRASYFFPLVWYIVIIGFFSVAGQKKLPYLLPMLPAQSLMLGLAAVPLLQLARRARMRGIIGAVLVIQTLVALAWVFTMPYMLRSVGGLGVLPIVLLALALVLVIVSARHMFAVRPGRWFVWQSFAYVCILIAFSAYYLTPANNVRSPAAVAREVGKLADGTHVAVVQSRLPEEVSFYLPLHPATGPAPGKYLAILDDHVDVEKRARSNHPVVPPAPGIEFFKDWFPNAKLVGVQRLELDVAPGDARWKVYEITVQHTGFARAQ